MAPIQTMQTVRPRSAPGRLRKSVAGRRSAGPCAPWDFRCLPIGAPKVMGENRRSRALSRRPSQAPVMALIHEAIWIPGSTSSWTDAMVWRLRRNAPSVGWGICISLNQSASLSASSVEALSRKCATCASRSCSRRRFVSAPGHSLRSHIQNHLPPYMAAHAPCKGVACLWKGEDRIDVDAQIARCMERAQRGKLRSI